MSNKGITNSGDMILGQAREVVVSNEVTLETRTNIQYIPLEILAGALRIPLFVVWLGWPVGLQRPGAVTS
jgi:hypothetical protein